MKAITGYTVSLNSHAHIQIATALKFFLLQTVFVLTKIDFWCFLTT